MGAREVGFEVFITRGSVFKKPMHLLLYDKEGIREQKVKPVATFEHPQTEDRFAVSHRVRGQNHWKHLGNYFCM